MKFVAEQKAFFGRNIVQMHLGGRGGGVECVIVYSLQQSEKKVGLFLSHPEGWGSCVKSQQLWRLCDWAATLTCTQIHSAVCIHVHIFF